MATSIYITSAEGSSGKSTIALGILDAVRARVERVGATCDGVQRDSEDALAIIVEKYRALEKKCNAVVTVGCY